MKRFAVVLVLGVVAVGIVAADGERSGGDGSRYLLTIVEVPVDGAATGHPLSLDELGKPGDAIRPRAANLAMDGFVGAVKHSKRILAAIRQRGDSEAIHRGELETRVRRKGTWISGVKIPVPVVSLRANARTVSTTFEEVGVKFEVEPLLDDHTNLLLEFSAASRLNSEVGPVIRKFSMRGTILLPDGYTAIYTCLDRVPSEVLDRMPAEVKQPGEVGKDLVTQYFVLVTRMDLDRGAATAEKGKE
jgi:hypothetical protein